MSYIEDYREHLNELIKKGSALPTNYLASKDILKDMSSLMHEFKESTFSLIYDEDVNGGKYTKSISPLFYDKVIDERNNLEFLDIITSFIPYYYLEPTLDAEDPEGVSLKETRDLGINDVPSPLQNNSFYSTWFRDAWGYVQNNLILDLFNKLRYPYINENQYLNSFLFPKLADEIFNKSTSVTADSYIGFMNTEEENDSVYDKKNYPYYGEEIGCLDYVDDIVNRKINASYSLIDYTNKQNVVLNKWGESLYASGQLSREDLDTSKTIFKLQDIKNELLRRKFSGSRTLYDLAINTVNRQGSFVTAIRYYDLPDETQEKDITYHNKRLIRVLRLPGLISKPFDFSKKLGLDLFKAYLETDHMPINTLLPLFFSSSPIFIGELDNNSKEILHYFDSEMFFSGITSEPESIENYKEIDPDKFNSLPEYQNYFLRDNSNIIDWGSIDGIIMTDNVNQRFRYLDEVIGYDDDGNPIYRTLDSLYDEEYDAKKAAEYAGNKYLRYSQSMRLDIKETVLDLNLVSSSVADVNADKVLYHRNSLQEILGEDYPYVTYPIANNNGLSLIDTYWLDYIEKEIRNKSKVQDNTEIGTQVNTMIPITPKNSDFRTGEHYFFGISFANEEDLLVNWGSNNLEIRDYEEGDNYALIWYCTLIYNSVTNEVVSFEKKLISKITLKEDINNIDDKFKKDGNILEEYKKYTEYNIGILPFTYNTAVDDVVWENNIGFLKSSQELELKDIFKDDTEFYGFSESYFMFSNNNILKNCIDIGNNPNKNLSYCKLLPSKETKTVFYIVKKSEFNEGIITGSGESTSEESHKSGTIRYDENGNMMIKEGVVEDKYYWSDPISVIHLTGDLIDKIKNSEFSPEWYNLGYFFNAYLNFNKNCASPLRNKFVIPSAKFKSLPAEVQLELTGGDEDNVIRDEQGNIKYIKNPGENAALSNLSRTRGLDFVCSDDGGDFIEIHTDESDESVEYIMKYPSFPTIWTEDLEDSHSAKKYGGMFLMRNRPNIGDVKPDTPNFEYSSIYGDNRFLDAFDNLYKGIITYERDKYEDVSGLRTPTEEQYDYLFAVIFIGKDSYEYFVWDRIENSYRKVDLGSSENRSKLCFDDNNINCLEIVSSNFNEDRSKGYWFKNYLTISDKFSTNNLSESVSKWYWNEYTNGKTIFFNIALNEDSRKILNNKIKVDGEEEEETSTEVKEMLLFEDSNFKLSIFSKYKDEEDNEKDARVSFSIYKNINKSESIGTSIYISNIDLNNNYRISASFLLGLQGPSILLGVNNKYTEIINNPNIPSTLFSTSCIELFSNYIEDGDSWSQENCFYGYIYDMRFYTCGKSEEELKILNSGSLRELYSYSPSNYKLANTIYRDTAALKKVYISNPNELPRIDSFRIFNRSVWDSILIDNCPVTKYESDVGSPQYREDFANPVDDLDIYKKVEKNSVVDYFLNDCVEQDLLKDIEVFNGLTSNVSNTGRVGIEYHSSSKPSRIEFDDNYLMTLVTALVEPGDYEEDSLNSIKLKFSLNKEELDNYKYIEQVVSSPEESEDGYRPIYIPVQSDLSDDYFSYSADIDYNFKLFSEFDISRWLSRGSNIQLEYNSSLDKSVARLSDISLRDSEKNNIILPFIVPNKKEDNGKDLYLDRFYAKDVVLSNNLSTFLNASSYYSEIQIPVSIIKGDVVYEELDENFVRYELSTTTYPEKGITYYIFDDSGELRESFIFPSKKSGVSYYIKRTSYDESSCYSPNPDIYIRVSATNDKGFNYVNVVSGEIWDWEEKGNENPPHIFKKASNDNEYIELDIDVNYFKDGCSYKYSTSEDPDHPVAGDPFLDLTNLENDNLYIKDGDTYSLCVSPYNVSREYYKGRDNYYNFEGNSFDLATVYYLKVSDTEFRPTTVEDFDGVGNTVFDKDRPYYTDFLTSGEYYCIYKDKYTLTNEAYSSISTFSDWYKHPGEHYYKDAEDSYQVVDSSRIYYIYDEETSSYVETDYDGYKDGSKTKYYYKESESSEVYVEYTPVDWYIKVKEKVGEEDVYKYYLYRDSLYLRNVIGTPTYYNKWDALRVLKEGTYYFTCKYPIQILPFTDDQFDSSPDSNYTTYYASCRFKVVVKGSPAVISQEIKDKTTISGYPKKYWAENLESTLKSSSQRYQDDDNRTFPHRIVDIDLYAMDIRDEDIAGFIKNSSELYKFKWVKIASNYDNSVFNLNKETVENQIVITSQIPFFLEKNYVSPFFISKYDRASEEESATSADDDIIYPIQVVSKETSDENIVSNSESDMDNQKIISGKSYKVLFEYTGAVTEISYIDKIYSENIFEDGSAEKINFARLVNLLDTTTLDTSEYMYNTDGRSFRDSLNVNYYTSGFKTESISNNSVVWKDVSSSVEDNRFFYFGCPYSRSSEKNYILKTRNTSLDSNTSINRIDSRQNINNSYTFPYVVEDNDSDAEIPAYIVPSLGLGAVVDDTGAFKRIPFDELSIIKSHYKELEGIVLNSISSLKTQSCGLFSGLSTFTPRFVENELVGDSYNSTVDDSLQFERINNEDYKLYGYFASSRLLKVKNDFVFLERRNLYSNNLLSNNSFENKSDWIITGAKSAKYVSDNNWGSGSGLSDSSGKDVFEIEPQSPSNEVSIKYSTGDLSIKAKYEAAICIKPINNESTNDMQTLTIDIVYYSGNVEVYRGNLDTIVDMDNGWYNYSAETEDVVVADSVEFIINCSSTFRITKAVIRKCNIVSQYLGLSNVLNQVTSSSIDSKITVTSHSMVVYQNKESGDFFPVQFNNEVINSVTLGGLTVKRPKSGLSRASEFISSYNLGSYGENSRLVELYSPWIRRFYYYSDNNGGVCRINKYQIKTNLLGKREIAEIKSNVSDIIKSESIVILDELDKDDSKHKLTIRKMPLILDENNCIEIFGMNLSVDEDNPIILTNERFTSLFNCLDPVQYREGKDYSVAVTNIQLLANNGSGQTESYKKNNVIYELEYLPIIYSERKNHLSLNILLYKETE